MKLGTLTVSGNKFRLPCVYEFLRKGAIIYVGRSNAGFSRAFTGYGSRKNDTRTEYFNLADSIRVTVFDNIEEATKEERKIIRDWHPIGNKHFNC